jgi:hypothetical protein
MPTKPAISFLAAAALLLSQFPFLVVSTQFLYTSFIQSTLPNRLSFLKTFSFFFSTILLFVFWIGAIFGNVSFIATIVTRLVPGRFGTIGRNVSHAATIETSTELGSSLVNHLSIISFQAWIGTITSNVSCLYIVDQKPFRIFKPWYHPRDEHQTVVGKTSSRAY